MKRFPNSMPAERYTVSSPSAESPGRTGRTYARRWPSYSLQPLPRKSPTSRATLWGLSDGSTTHARVLGITSTEPGMSIALNWRTLTSKYLTREEKGIWSQDSEKVRAMYRALRRLDASEQTIFLLVVELGTIAEAARRLGVHRSTITRVYNRIKEKIGYELERH